MEARMKVTTRICAFFSHLCAWVALFLCVLWGIGQFAGDRTHFTQYLYWLPTYAVLAGAFLALQASWVLAVFIGKQARGKSTHNKATATPRYVGSTARRVLLVIMCIVTCALVYEWKLWRGIGGGRESVVPRSERVLGELRVLHVNPSVAFFDEFATSVAKYSPDIVCITNRPGNTDWDTLRATVGGAGSMARFLHLTVVSKYPIVRWGGTKLGVQGARQRVFVWYKGGEISQDQGEGLFVELDSLQELGFNMVVWMLDMPSDPQLARRDLFAQANETIQTFRGPIFARNKQLLDVEEAPGSFPPGFPHPDLIVGDLNTPRGSWSMTQVARGLAHAHDIAGSGPAFTWTTRVPWIAIDQAFVSPRFEVRTYSTHDLGGGMHMAQVMDLNAAPPTATPTSPLK